MQRAFGGWSRRETQKRYMMRGNMGATKNNSRVLSIKVKLQMKVCIFFYIVIYGENDFFIFDSLK